MIFLLAALLWQSDWNTAFAQAKQQHKLVFVDYYQSKCAPCQEVERVVLPNETMQRELAGFVVLKVDLDRAAIPREHRYAPPAYVVFDWAGRERFRVDGADLLRPDDWHQLWDVKNNLNYPLYGPLDTFRAAAPAFVKAAELFDAKRDLDANFLVASTYHRLMMTEHARAAYAEAQKIALRQGNAAVAQSAEVQSAYTYVTERHAPRAIELLKPLTKTPVNREAETLIWLTLGHAYEAATDKPDAIAAFRKAQSLATAGSRAQKEAAAALTRLK